MSRRLSSEAAATLQASIGLPPPKATNASAPTRSAWATRARTELAGTCCPTPANTPAQCGPTAAVTRSRSGEAPKVLPVATSARVAPIRSSSAPSVVILPGPNAIRSSRVKVNSKFVALTPTVLVAAALKIVVMALSHRIALWGHKHIVSGYSPLPCQGPTVDRPAEGGRPHGPPEALRSGREPNGRFF